MAGYGMFRYRGDSCGYAGGVVRSKSPSHQGESLAEPNVPHRVRRVAAEERLGAVRDVHDPRSIDRRARIWLIVLSLPGLVLLPFTVVFLAHGIGWASGLSLMLTLVYLGGAARILFRDVLPEQGRVAYVFENGLVVASWRAVTAYPWDAIAELRVSGVRRAAADAVTWRLTLKRQDGAETSVGGGSTAARDLVETVSQEVTERVLPKYVSRVEAGGVVRLGPFTVSRAGIAKDGENVPWERISGVHIRDGMVYVDRSDRLAGMAATAGEVPNAIAFGELARYVRDSHNAQAVDPSPDPHGS